MAAVEARTGKALINRGFVMTLSEWPQQCSLVFPIAPVVKITGVTLVDRVGMIEAVDPERYALRADMHSPRIVSTGSSFPTIPKFGSVELRFDAGYALDFGGLPADLAQAVLMLAAHYYEYRDETTLSQGCMPFGVTSLIARYRPVRLGFTS